MYRKTFTYEGKRYYISAKTKEELNKKVKSKKKEVMNFKVYTFEEWCKVYFETYKYNISNNTLYNYHLRIDKYILPFIGNKRLDKITSIDCQKIINNVSGMSNNYIHKIYHDMKQIFNKAVFNRLILFNPADGIEVPHGYSSTHRSLHLDERPDVYRVCLEDFEYSGIFVMLMLCCGCRPEETSIIRNSDIENNILHIHGHKTSNADRTVPIPDMLLNLLPKLSNRDYLVCSLKGISPTLKHHRVALWRRFKSFLSICDEDLTPYCMRHTYCTDLQDAGVPVTVAKDFMGHSNIHLTADVYTHKSLKSFEDSTRKINAHLNTQCNGFTFDELK